jgi:hypothetical protein
MAIDVSISGWRASHPSAAEDEHNLAASMTSRLQARGKALERKGVVRVMEVPASPSARDDEAARHRAKEAARRARYRASLSDEARQRVRERDAARQRAKRADPAVRHRENARQRERHAARRKAAAGE